MICGLSGQVSTLRGNTCHNVTYRIFDTSIRQRQDNKMRNEALGRFPFGIPLFVNCESVGNVIVNNCLESSNVIGSKGSAVLFGNNHFRMLKICIPNNLPTLIRFVPDFHIINFIYTIQYTTFPPICQAVKNIFFRA